MQFTRLMLAILCAALDVLATRSRDAITMRTESVLSASSSSSTGTSDTDGVETKSHAFKVSLRAERMTSRLMYTTPSCQLPSRDKAFPGEIVVFMQHDNVRSFSHSTQMNYENRVRCTGEINKNCTGADPPSPNLKACDPLLDSCGCDMDPSWLHSPIHRQMMTHIQPMCVTAKDNTKRKLAEDPFRILMVGLGSGAIPMWLLDNCRVYVQKGLKIESLELDSRIIDVAENFLGFRTLDDVNTVEKGEYAHAVQVRVNQSDAYDAIVINAFDASNNVPEAYRNKPFLQNLFKLLRPRGVVVQNLRKAEFEDAVKQHTAAFGRGWVEGISKVEGASSQARIVVSKKPGPPLSGASRPSVLASVLFAMVAAGASAM